MLRIGVTGRMASGKSTVARRFEEHGAVRLDGDALGWEVLGHDDVRDAIARAFGTSVVDESGAVSRPRLGAIVFADPAAMERLNAIVQPALRAMVVARLGLEQSVSTRPEPPRAAPRGAGNPDVLVLDAALISTWNLEDSLDGVVEVVAPEAARVARLRRARGYDEAEAAARIAGQRLPPLRASARRWRIENDGDEEALRASADRVWQEITRLEAARRDP